MSASCDARAGRLSCPVRDDNAEARPPRHRTPHEHVNHHPTNQLPGSQTDNHLPPASPPTGARLGRTPVAATRQSESRANSLRLCFRRDCCDWLSAQPPPTEKTFLELSPSVVPIVCLSESRPPVKPFGQLAEVKTDLTIVPGNRLVVHRLGNSAAKVSSWTDDSRNFTCRTFVQLTVYLSRRDWWNRIPKTP